MRGRRQAYHRPQFGSTVRLIHKEMPAMIVQDWVLESQCSIQGRLDLLVSGLCNSAPCQSANSIFHLGSRRNFPRKKSGKKCCPLGR